MFSLRFGSSHVSMLNCIYKITGRKVKFNAGVKRRRYAVRLDEWLGLKYDGDFPRAVRWWPIALFNCCAMHERC